MNEAWAAVVAAHAFDALIHRLRWMHFRDGYLVSENNARAARRDDVVRKTPLENADADAVRVKHDQHESVVFHAPNIPNIRLMRLTGRDARSAEALAASALRRCLDFGALDESQALALAADGIAGRRARVLSPLFVSRTVIFAERSRRQEGTLLSRRG